MRSDVVQTHLQMLTTLFSRMSRCFGEDGTTLARSLALISAKHRLDPNFINFDIEERKLDRALNDSEAARVDVPELSAASDIMAND